MLKNLRRDDDVVKRMFGGQEVEAQEAVMYTAQAMSWRPAVYYTSPVAA